MGFLRRLFGGGDNSDMSQQAPERQRYGQPGARTADERAVERYRYLLRTAPPETIEQAHAEAFAQLTPEQRRLALQELAAATPPHERDGASDDPRALARLATRAELRQPGTLERAFGGAGLGGGLGMGGLIAGTLLSSIAGTLIGTAIAQQFFDEHPDPGAGDPGGSDVQDAPPEELAADQTAFEDPGFEDPGFDAGFDPGGDFSA